MTIDSETISTLIREASRFFRINPEASAEAKGYGNYVTAADRGIESFLKEELQKQYPEVQFLGEEQDNSSLDLSGSVWILDPVDGTMNFIRDYAHSAISLAYAEHGTLLNAWILDPYRNELFTAERGHGAFCNGSPIHVSTKPHLKDAIVFCGTSPYHRELSGWYFDIMHAVFDSCQDIRRTASAVLDLAWTACGRADAYFEHVYSWDRAAGMLLVEEAGGKVTDFHGNPAQIFGFADVAAGTPGVLEDLLPILQKENCPPIRY
ncbi:MAG: inositol monophosphatase family protein [Bulleidia sp.]